MANRMESLINRRIASDREVEAQATQEEKEQLKATKKKLKIKEKKELYSFRFEDSMMEDFKIYCDAIGSNMSKEISKAIQIIIINNQGLINDRKKRQ